MKKEPPLVLVKTWYELIMQSEIPEVKQHAAQMLVNVFGDMQTAAAYLKKHNLVNNSHPTISEID